jgi:carbon-monoxide dehydrogenase medium subunit
MIPKEFDYVAPGTLDEALAALRDGGEEAKVLAGGHSLIPSMKLRLAAPTLLVDLRRIGDLQRMGANNGHVDIGSMVTYHALHSDETAMRECPLLTECAYSIGDAQVRARGTVGGSLAHADPAADLPAAILALDATVLTTTGEIAARDFFQGLFTTALEPGQIVTGVRVPRKGERTGSAYVKIRNKASHFAVVGVAAALSVDAGGVCTHASVAVTGAASTPFRLERVESALVGGRLEDEAVRSATKHASSADADWMSDLSGSEEYRKYLTAIVAARAVQAARVSL